jgi:hypothetical protein
MTHIPSEEKDFTSLSMMSADPMPARLRNSVAGYMVTRLGEMTGNKKVISFGNGIMNLR